MHTKVSITLVFFSCALGCFLQGFHTALQKAASPVHIKSNMDENSYSKRPNGSEQIVQGRLHHFSLVAVGESPTDLHLQQFARRRSK